MSIQLRVTLFKGTMEEAKSINIDENKDCSIGNNARGDEYIYEQTLIIEHVYVLGEYHKYGWDK